LGTVSTIRAKRAAQVLANNFGEFAKLQPQRVSKSR
jgi:hypothetical protein